MSHRLVMLIIGAACGLLAAMTPLSAVQLPTDSPSPEAPPGWEFDFDLFETLLQSRNLQSRTEIIAAAPIDQWSQAFRDPSTAVMIFTGRVPSEIGWRQVHNFLADGGVILIATSEPCSVYGFFSIEYGPAAAVDPDDALPGHRDCLQVLNINPSTRITTNVERIVTNQSGWIAELQGSFDYRWTPLASLPRQRLRPRRSQGKLLAAIASAQDRGRMLVLADDSPLSNGMLWYGDNLKLLINIVEELTHDDRRQYAFLQGGQPVRNRVTELLVDEAIDRQEELPDIPPEALAELPAETLLEIGNTVAASIEDSDVLNELAVDRPRHLQDRYYRRSILLALCGAALAVFLVRSWLTGQTALPWTRKRRPPETADPPASLMSLQFGQAVQALARDTCRQLTNSHDPDDWRTQLSRDGGIWRQLSTRSESPQTTIDTIARILLWSSQPPEASMTRREFERFGEAIYELKQLHVPEDSPGSRLAWT